MARVAILIDGGYLVKRLPALRPEFDINNPAEAANAINQLFGNHLNHLNRTYRHPNAYGLLHRVFYYDAQPVAGRGRYPISRNPINYTTTPSAQFRTRLFEILRGMPNVALRLGRVHNFGDRSWILTPRSQADLLAGRLSVDDLTDDHFKPTFRQKGVDMKLGIDIASLTLRKQVDVIVLVSGDSDFVPAAKLARREGVRIILDPLCQSVSPDLNEHIDGLRHGLMTTSQTEAAENHNTETVT